MNIKFQNERQAKIAELMWNAPNESLVHLMLKTYGHDAQVVYHMLIAETYDQCMDTNLAEDVLVNF